MILGKKKTRILYQRFLSLKRTKRSSVGEDAIVEGRDILILLLVLRLGIGNLPRYAYRCICISRDKTCDNDESKSFE